MEFASAHYWFQWPALVTMVGFLLASAKSYIEVPEMLAKRQHIRAFISIALLLVTLAGWAAVASREERMAPLPDRVVPDEQSMTTALEAVLSSIPLVMYCNVDNTAETNQYSAQLIGALPNGMKPSLVSPSDCSPLKSMAAYGLFIGVADAEHPPQAAIDFQRAIAAGKMIQPPRFAQIGISESQGVPMISAKGHQPIGKDEFWFIVGANSKAQHEAR